MVSNFVATRKLIIFQLFVSCLILRTVGKLQYFFENGECHNPLTRETAIGVIPLTFDINVLCKSLCDIFCGGKKMPFVVFGFITALFGKIFFCKFFYSYDLHLGKVYDSRLLGFGKKLLERFYMNLIVPTARELFEKSQFSMPRFVGPLKPKIVVSVSKQPNPKLFVTRRSTRSDRQNKTLVSYFSCCKNYTLCYFII